MNGLSDMSRRSFCLASTALAATATVASAQQPGVAVGLASASFATAALRIAGELGLLTKHGVNARFVVTESSVVALTGVLSKSFEFGVIGLPELIIAQARGQKVVGIANVYGGFATSAVLSKAAQQKIGVAADAPIAQRYKALDGLLLATPSATAGGTIAFLAAAKANGATVRMTYMAQPAMQAALDTGAIDGFLSSAPFWAYPVVKGNGLLWISGPKGDFPSASTPTVTAFLVANREYAEANRDLVAKFKAVVADLGQAIAQRPAEVKAAVAKLYPDVPGPALDILFEAESVSWNAKQLTPADLAKEIAVVKLMGIPIPPLIDTIDPATILFP